jgi:hypothetical protein
MIKRNLPLMITLAVFVHRFHHLVELRREAGEQNPGVHALDNQRPHHRQQLLSGFPPELNQVVKAVVVLCVLIVQSPRFIGLLKGGKLRFIMAAYPFQ